jgi:hypothetical protein
MDTNTKDCEEVSSLSLMSDIFGKITRDIINSISPFLASGIDRLSWPSSQRWLFPLKAVIQGFYQTIVFCLKTGSARESFCSIQEWLSYGCLILDWCNLCYLNRWRASGYFDWLRQPSVRCLCSVAKFQRLLR